MSCRGNLENVFLYWSSLYLCTTFKCWATCWNWPFLEHLWEMLTESSPTWSHSYLIEIIGLVTPYFLAKNLCSNQRMNVYTKQMVGYKGSCMTTGPNFLWLCPYLEETHVLPQISWICNFLGQWHGIFSLWHHCRASCDNPPPQRYIQLTLAPLLNPCGLSLNGLLILGSSSRKFRNGFQWLFCDHQHLLSFLKTVFFLFFCKRTAKRHLLKQAPYISSLNREQTFSPLRFFFFFFK